MVMNKIREFLLSIPTPSVVWLAYSGGVDSHVLLHTVVNLKKTMGITLKAIHINHQISVHANEWEEHCQKTCEKLNVPFYSERIDIHRAGGESLEACARNKRYDIFSRLVEKDNYVLTGHHLDDQAETVLLQLMRGTGVKGLSAMAEKQAFSAGFLVRPLLSISRKEILQEALIQQLQWIEDESNESLDFERNFLRHQVIPLLEKKRPQVVQAMARTAKHCAQAAELLEELAKIDFVVMQHQEGGLSAKALLNLSIARQSNVIRYWLQINSCILPSTLKLEHILHDVVSSRYDMKPCVVVGEVAIKREKDRIFLALA
jgi:tRNA(Ile)-lysidine synthase